jgi:hypothetical protein
MPALASRLFENPDDPWATVTDTPWGDIPAWKASTMATGTMGAYETYVAHARDELQRYKNDAVSILHDAEEKIATLKTLQDGVMRMLHRMDQQVTRLEEQRRHDEEMEQERRKFEEPISAPPGMGDSTPGEPSDPEDDAAAGPAPGGELHSVPAKEDPLLEEMLAEDQGSLPEHLVKEAPPEYGSYPTLEEKPKPQVNQPTAVSLW